MYVLEVLKVAIRFKKMILIIRKLLKSNKVKPSNLYGTCTARKVVFILYQILKMFTQVLFVLG